ncbi:MAG: MFS transporter [Betaproteobacteria bacterium]|nr:MFS transporter [Betaproteobacteria bacterium]
MNPVRRVSLFFATYFAYVGLFSPYLSLWLNGRGFSPSEIGVLLSPMQWARVVGPPAWGALADHVAAPRVPRIIQLAALAALLSAGLLLLDWSFWGLFAVLCLISFFLSGQVPIAESLAMQASRGDMGLYGRMRVWGSSGFILAVVLGGLWLDAMGTHVLPASLMLVLALVAISALWLPEREVHDLAPRSGALRETLSEKRVRLFLLASFLMVLAHAPLYTLFSLWLEHQGYSRTEIGLLWMLGVLAEIVFFRIQRPLFERWGLSFTWRLSFLVAALRFGLVALSGGSLAIILLTQLMHAATFGAHHSASMALVREWFPAQAQARGQALYTMASYGLGGSLGGMAVGWVYEAISPEAAFMSASVAAGLGWWVASRASRLGAPGARGAGLAA